MIPNLDYTASRHGERPPLYRITGSNERWYCFSWRDPATRSNTSVR